MKKFINHDDGSELDSAANIVFKDEEIVIVKYHEDYSWYTEPEKRHDLILWCRATYQIKNFELADRGYPISEIISEENLIHDCKSVDDVRRLKENNIIKWHDVAWNTSTAFTGGPSEATSSQVIEIKIKNGSPAPERAPKFILSDGYYRHGEHFHFEEEME